MSGYELAEVRAKELGELVANDPAAFDVLLPLLVTNQQGRHWSFGRGLQIIAGEETKTSPTSNISSQHVV